MPRRAEWRRLPDDPATVVAWIPRVLCETSSLLLLFAACLGLLGWLFHLTALVGGIVGVLLLGRLLPYRSPRPSSDLSTLPLPEESFSVGVTVLYHGTPTGTDDGIASFVEGWLHVEGRRTSFSLRANDGRARLGIATPTLNFELDGGAFDIALEPALFASASRRRIGNEHRSFVQSSKAWMHDASPTGEPILPPREVQPEAYARKIVHTVLLLGVCAAASAALWNAPLMASTVFPMLGFWSLAILAPIIPIRSWAMLRGLEKENPLPYERERLTKSSAEDEGS